ncbi:MAG: PorV/PorQ family protein [Candidatus Marinimicrobia bacterium]|nr:PorV/PorQ family protein [Candidatus Neomarinimicrobiota bacterium]MCF7827696.1 PorV/PorQ family protein [Candidatus Neomarinimicrobiota bacterium]MCF7881249.1 PorV/PorQ family protein [Candidatus Neomarinimicrobiota bacterium]
MLKTLNTLVRNTLLVLLLIGSPGLIFAQSEASGIFLLIAPGARAGGMGEAQVALANDAYASYWNPAGLAFQDKQELAAMHVNWLPGLADDLYYEFVAYQRNVPNLGTFGAHFVYLSLGEQIRTGETGPDALDTFYSYMWNISLSYGAALNDHSAFGMNAKVYRQFLAPEGAAAELDKDGASTDFAFDLAYLNKQLFTDRLAFGATLSNMGPSVTFIDADQADPPPTTLRVGVNIAAIQGEHNTVNIVYDASKMLVAKDDQGRAVPFYKAIFTSWFDDDPQTEINQILHNFGAEYWYSQMFAIRVGGFYQVSGDFTSGSDDPGEAGGYPIPTFGAGIRYANYGFDFGYIAGDDNHPLNNTMRFSLNMQF